MPVWVSWVQALAPTFIAIIALIITAWIQIGQSRTARNKLKLDLFNERYPLLQSVRNIVSLGLSLKPGDESYFKKLDAEYRSFTKQKLFFPKEIGNLIEQVVLDCDSLQFDGKFLSYDHPFTPDEREKIPKLRQKLRQDMKALSDKLEEFIRVDWNG